MLCFHVHMNVIFFSKLLLLIIIWLVNYTSFSFFECFCRPHMHRLRYLSMDGSGIHSKFPIDKLCAKIFTYGYCFIGIVFRALR